MSLTNAMLSLDMMRREIFAIADIYVPIKRRTALEQTRVDEIAASMLDAGQRFWLRLCTGWKPPRRLAKKLSSAFSSPRGNTE
jgi:hypothetical protein